VPRFLTKPEVAVIAAAADRLIPPLDAHPGGAALGVAEYIDNLLGAFTFDPPLIFAGGPYSGRFGGDASFRQFLTLLPNEEIAWRTRIEGSLGRPEREFNGPTRGWQAIYREGIAALGEDFCAVDGAEQDLRLSAQPELRRVLYEHACEGAYGPPEYGGNRDLEGWRVIGWEGDVQPRGYTDDEVTGRA
jgi:Gluconate 2-dehydrogenase subunit 3